jgi:hypothetical protein
MKKALLIMTALVMIASFAFAQDAAAVKIGAWGRTIFAPAVGGGNTIVSVLGTSWSNATPRIGWTIAGSSTNAGFQVDMNADGVFNPGTLGGKAFTPGDQQKVWIKPISMVTIQAGNIFDDTLRGSVSFGSYNWIRLTWTGDDVVFQRVIAQNGGIEVNAAPVDGLYIYGAVGNILAGMTDAGNMLAMGQYGAGYTIPNIGVARAQYIGVSTTLGTINAAFKLTAVPNLTIDLGGFIPTKSTGIDGAGYLAKIALFASYAGVEKLTINAFGTVDLPQSDLTNGKMKMEIGAGADYSLDGGITLSADVRYVNPQGVSGYATTLDKSLIGFMLAATMGFSNGSIGIGFEGTTQAFAPDYLVGQAKSTADALVWAIPIKLEYWF